jgi:hypothetical protein
MIFFVFVIVVVVVVVVVASSLHKQQPINVRGHFVVL